MRKPDDDLKLDINEIFGASESLPETPIPEEPVAMADPMAAIKFNDMANTPVVEPMVITIKSKATIAAPEISVADEVKNSVDPTIVETKEVEAPKVETSEIEGSSLIIKSGRSGTKRDPSAEDFFAAYDHFRTIFIDELKDSAGLRKTDIMMVKTFEAARQKYPEVFRNANWDASGNLLEDGSLNTQRMLDNKATLSEKQADIILDTALISLLTLRLEAVEKGLGVDHLHKLKTRLKKWIDEESQKDGYGKNDPKVLKRLSHFLL